MISIQAAQQSAGSDEESGSSPASITNQGPGDEPRNNPDNPAAHYLEQESNEMHHRVEPTWDLSESTGEIKARESYKAHASFAMARHPPVSPKKGTTPRVDDPDEPAELPSRPTSSTMELDLTSVVNRKEHEQSVSPNATSWEDLKAKMALRQQKEDSKTKQALQPSVTAATRQTMNVNVVQLEDPAPSLSHQKQVWSDRRRSVDEHQNGIKMVGGNDRDNGAKSYDTPGAYPISGLFGITLGEDPERYSPTGHRPNSVRSIDTMEEGEGQLAIAARVVERTDDEIEDAVRKRLLAEAVKAEAVSVIPDQEDIRKRHRRRRCSALVVFFIVIVVIVISVAAAMKKKNNSDDGPKIVVAFQFDQFAEETGWNLTCTSGKNSSDVVRNVEVPQGSYNVSFSYVLSDPIAVEYGYECQLRVSDLFGDGFCCRHGDGYFALVLQESGGDILLHQESGEFASETVVNFTVTAPSPSKGNSSSVPNNSTAPPLWRPIGPDVNGNNAGDKLGSSVSLTTWNNETIVAIGAPGELSGNSPGYVKVQLYGTNGTRQLGQVIFGEKSTGSSVSLSGDGRVLAVGAPTGMDEVIGSVIVYQYDDNADWWSLKGNKIVGGDDGFGTSASISANGTTLVVGAPFAKGTGGEESLGRVQVFMFNVTSSKWSQLGQDIVGTTQGDQFGFSVSISNDGRMVAAGAPSPGAERPGYSSVYQYGSLSRKWLRIGNIIMGSENGDESGTSVSLSGNGTRVAVGSPHITQGAAGYARVLKYNSTDWEQVGRDLVDISGAGAESVSLSNDGLSIAIGARTANATGRVRVFRQENMTCVYPFCWEQVGENIVGDEPGALFGDAVSLSRDGSVLAVGSPFADEASGAARLMASTNKSVS